MKSNQYLRYISIALSLLATFAVTVIWHAPRVRAAIEPATIASPALQGNAALEHLKQQGLYSSLRSALGRMTLNATLATSFTQLTQITAFDAEEYDEFGYRIALSGDTVVIGAPRDEPAGTMGQEEGAAYVFVRTGNSYTFQRKLTAPDHAFSDFFGLAVAIDGETIVVGAPGAGDGHGKAYVFVRSGTQWSMQQKLTDGQIIANDEFGSAVAISGNTVVIGAQLDDNGSNANQGSVYVFVRSGTTWSLQQKLTANDGTANDFFGADVALFGNTLLVGAPFQQQQRGAVYVFTRSVATWTQQQKLTASDGIKSDNFGYSVDLDGNTAVIGAAAGGADAANTSQGAAYVFVRSGNSWSQQQKLTANDLSGSGLFGHDVAIKGDTVVIGAVGDSYNNQVWRGSAYVFTRTGTAWSQSQKLTDSNGYASNYFGMSVALGTDAILIGASRKAGERGAVIAFAQAVNTPPTLSALPITRSAGSPSAVASIANVGDAEDAENTLPVTLTNNPTSNGVTLSGLSVDSAGVVSATIATACNATTASFNLSVIDSGGASNVTTLTVTVPPNTAPTLSYASPQIISLGSGAKIIPATGPSDNGMITSLVLQSVTPGFSGIINLNAAGEIAVANAGPAGNYTVVVRATDNCGAIRNATLTLTVPGNCPPLVINPSSLANGRVGLNYQQSLSVTASGVVQYTYSLVAGSGALPYGMQLSPQGVLSGAPTQPGSFQFTVRGTGSNGCLVARTYNLFINPQISPILRQERGF